MRKVSRKPKFWIQSGVTIVFIYSWYVFLALDARGYTKFPDSFYVFLALDARGYTKVPDSFYVFLALDVRG